MYISVYIRIYIYIERERYTHLYIYNTYIYIYMHTLYIGPGSQLLRLLDSVRKDDANDNNDNSSNTMHDGYITLPLMLLLLDTT